MVSVSIIFLNLGKHKNVNIANFVYFGKTRLQLTFLFDKLGSSPYFDL